MHGGPAQSLNKIDIKLKGMLVETCLTIVSTWLHLKRNTKYMNAQIRIRRNAHNINIKFKEMPSSISN